MRTITLTEFRENPDAALRLAPVVITRRGKPVAQLVPLAPTGKGDALALFGSVKVKRSSYVDEMARVNRR